MSLILLLSAMILSHRQVFWIDETYSWNLIHDPSLVHANYALRQAADGGLPVYYNLAWVWDRLTGGSVLALRLFSVLASIAGLWILWSGFRRLYRLWPAALALFTIFGGSNLLLRADAEVRFYGLFFAACCAVFTFALAVSGPQERERSSAAISIAGAFLLNEVLVYTHIFGFVYSVLMLTGLIVADLYVRRIRFGLYLGWAASWLLLLTWMRPLKRLAATGQPHGYIVVPHLHDLVTAYTFRLPLLALFLLVVVGCGVLRAWTGRLELQVTIGGPDTRRVAAVCMAVSMLLLPLLVYAVSHVHTPIFEMRYFLPSLIGLGVLLAEIARWAEGSAPLDPVWMRFSFGALLVVFLLYPLVYAAKTKVPGFNAAVVASVEAYHLPVEVEDAHYFFPMEFLAGKDKGEFFYPLDYQDSLAPNADLGGTLDVNIARILARLGYYKGQIVSGDAPVCWPKFLVVDSSDLFWYDRHIANDPDYRSQVIGPFPASDRPEPTSQLILVTRTRPCS